MTHLRPEARDLVLLPAADQIALGQRLIEEGRSARDVAKMFKVHVATFYRALGKPAPAAEIKSQAALAGH
jgi:transposase